jgi:hypothetical protein
MIMTSVDDRIGDLSFLFHKDLNYDIIIQYHVHKDGKRYQYTKFVRGVYKGFIGEKPNRKFIFETDITKKRTAIEEKDFTNELGELTAIIREESNDLVAAAAINPLLSKNYKIKF